MKKSELYYFAMVAVLENAVMTADLKLEIIEQLLKDKQYAELTEEQNPNKCEK